MKKDMLTNTNSKELLLIAFFAVLFCITIGYAYLTSSLTINGMGSIKNPTWDIHFENVQVNSESVDSEEPVIDSLMTTVTYSVHLTKPGDFYEFTVDVVNAGTIDAMIDSISSKMNNVEIETLPNWLVYSVSYSDDVLLEPHQSLDVGQTETVKIRVEYNQDLSASDLPDVSQELEFSFHIVYVQKTNESVERDKERPLYSVLENEYLNGGSVHLYSGEHQDSMSGVGSKNIYHWYAESDEEGNEVLEKNNVLFGGFCWQILRTTDTGGVKIIYNGVANGESCDIVPSAIGSSYYIYSHVNLPFLAGYMYNPDTIPSQVSEYEIAPSGTLFGKGVSYYGGQYHLTNTKNSLSNNAHYTCYNSTGVCDTVRFCYYHVSSEYDYIELQNGRTVESAFSDMLDSPSVNAVDSNAKAAIETWYQNNLNDYSSYIEDVIYCNNRSYQRLGAWSPEGDVGTALLYSTSATSLQSLNCPNVTDRFSLHNESAKLKYPIALPTAPEINLLNNRNLIAFRTNYWTMTPYYFSNGALHYSAMTSGVLDRSSTGGATNSIRPVISLAPGITYFHGNGSKANPYVVVTN